MNATQPFVVGTVEGTGSAINVQLGFAPSYVKCYNYDDGVTQMEWFSGMTDGHGLKSAAAAHSKVTSNGISAYAGTSGGDSAGFTIGADADLNASAETIYYIAFR